MTPRRGDDAAGAETVGALILFGIFVMTIAFLNVSAVPQAGLAAEEEHVRRLLDDMNALQVEAEAAALPENEGATIGASLALSPDRSVGSDFFSFFLADPARAAGEITFVQDHGNVTLTHHQGMGPVRVDIGSTTAQFPMGRLRLDPHPVYRSGGILQLENGALVTTDGSAESLRFSPPITARNDSGTILLTVKARILNGTDASVGGASIVRVGLLTEAATLVSTSSPNARNVTLRLETDHGAAWATYLSDVAEGVGLAAWTSGAEVGYQTVLQEGAAPGGLDVVTWRVFGASGAASNDIALSYGLGIYTVTLS